MFLHHGAVRDPERLTARVFDSATRSAGCRLDTYRDGDTYHVDIDLPGVDPADIDVAVDGKVLTIRAARPPRGPAPDHRRVGSFPLADSLDTDRLEARYADGTLTLRIPIIEPAAQPAEFRQAA